MRAVRSATASGRAPVGLLARRKLVAQDPIALKVDDRSTERPRAVLGTRVHADRAFEFRGVLRLVDVPVEPEDRLGFEDRGTKGRAADRDQNLLASLHHGAWRVRRLVELRSDVQPGLKRRRMHQIDGMSRILDAAQERIETLLEAVFREFSWPVPG